MSPTRILTILMATLIVSNAGCTGSRLRNLISRSDYQSIEDLEAQDALVAEREAAAREKALAAGGDEADKEVLVSQERDLDDDASDAEPVKKRSLFNFAALFNRKSDDSELGADPFVEVSEKEEVEAEEQKNATVAAETEDNRVASISAAAAEQYVAQAARAEETAETLFRQIPPKSDNEADPASRSDLPEISAAKAVETAGQSFADFVNEQSAAVTTEAQETVNDSADALLNGNFVAGVNENRPESGATFDALLQSSQSKSDPSPSIVESPSQLFPGLEQLIPDEASPVAAAETNAAGDSEFDQFLSTNEALAPMVAEVTPRNAPQAEPAEQGFSQTEDDDPWAAFRQTQADYDLATGDGTEKTASAVPEAEFAWANAPQTHNPQPLPEGFSITDSDTEAFDAAGLVTNDVSPFSNVSATAVDSEPASPFHIPDPQGLVIPAGGTQPAPVTLDDGDLFSSANSGADLQDDPFAAADESAGFGSTAFPALPSATPSASTGISTRTWFLLLGCLIVALLLFMPERQNRRSA